MTLVSVKRKLSEEHRRKLADARRGVKAPHSEETKRKIGDAMRGKRWTEERRAMQSQRHKGKRLSPECVAKIAESNRGKKRSPETRARIAAAVRGHKMSPEAKAKRAKTYAQRVMSPEELLGVGDGRYGGHLFKDGRSRHPHYRRWTSMMTRCYKKSHPSYRHHGARGISIHDAWHNPWVFYAYLDEVLGPRPDDYSLDRIDNDGNYEPGNVRWATRLEQNHNRRPYGSAWLDFWDNDDDELYGVRVLGW